MKGICFIWMSMKIPMRRLSEQSRIEASVIKDDLE